MGGGLRGSQRGENPRGLTGGALHSPAPQQPHSHGAKVHGVFDDAAVAGHQAGVDGLQEGPGVLVRLHLHQDDPGGGEGRELGGGRGGRLRGCGPTPRPCHSLAEGQIAGGAPRGGCTPFGRGRPLGTPRRRPAARAAVLHCAPPGHAASLPLLPPPRGEGLRVLLCLGGHERVGGSPTARGPDGGTARPGPPRTRETQTEQNQSPSGTAAMRGRWQ